MTARFKKYDYGKCDICDALMEERKIKQESGTSLDRYVSVMEKAAQLITIPLSTIRLLAMVSRVELLPEAGQ